MKFAQERAKKRFGIGDKTRLFCYVIPIAGGSVVGIATKDPALTLVSTAIIGAVAIPAGEAFNAYAIKTAQKIMEEVDQPENNPYEMEYRRPR